MGLKMQNDEDDYYYGRLIFTRLIRIDSIIDAFIGHAYVNFRRSILLEGHKSILREIEISLSGHFLHSYLEFT